MTTIADLQDWRVTFTMRTMDDQERTFSLVIPATHHQAALDGAHDLAYVINDASGHVWKITEERRAELDCYVGRGE